MMKTTITLDPEYIPWEPGAPVVRLRRKRNKRLRAALSVGFVVVFIVAAMVFGLNSPQPATEDETETAPVATPALAAPSAIPTPALITRGQPGSLAIARRNAIMFYRCQQYIVYQGDTVIAAGETADGPIVEVEVSGEVSVECDHQVFIIH